MPSPDHRGRSNGRRRAREGDGASAVLDAPAQAADPRPPALTDLPDARGRFGRFGGRYVPETLVAALTELDDVYRSIQDDAAFWSELSAMHRDFTGRPTPLCRADALTRHARRLAKDRGVVSSNADPKGAQIWLKREDLAHTGAHKINNTLGQALLCKKMGKQRIIAETGAGQHGVASATAAARLGLECDVYMGAEDVRRQHLNVVRMRMLGARVVPVESGSRTLKDATNEAMRDWMGSVESTHYILGSVVGPHPFPMIVRDFQSVIGRETKAQCLRKLGRLPDAVVACVGGGSNAAGIFFPFVGDESVRLYGTEAGGRGDGPGDHAAPLQSGSPGVLHGSLSYVLQDEAGQTGDVHSCSAGLDYPGVGPEHSHWKETGRVIYGSVTDERALDALLVLSRLEGVLPALETAHAVAHAVELAGEMSQHEDLVLCCSGRGDKDVDEAFRLLDGRIEPQKARATKSRRRRKRKKSAAPGEDGPPASESPRPGA